MTYTTNPICNINFSKCKKLNALLNNIADSLTDMGMDEVKRYYEGFPREIDYNIAQYGNLLVYFGDVRELYRLCGYKSLNAWSDSRVWETYRRQVGYVARYLLRLYGGKIA